MKTVKLLALLLCALSLSGAQLEPPTKQLGLQWTTVERRSPSPDLYRINSLWCGQAYCELKILYIFGCNAGSSTISSEQMRTGSPYGLQVTRTGKTVSVLMGNGQLGTREQLTYRITAEGPDTASPAGLVQNGRVIQYEGIFNPGDGRTHKLEPVKGPYARVSIPCPVIVPGVDQD